MTTRANAERPIRPLGERLRQLVEDHHDSLLAATLFISLSVRFGVLLDLRKTIYSRALMPDEDIYHRWAASLAAGKDLPGFARDFPRLPALAFSAVYWLLGTNTLYIRVLNVLLGVAVVGTAYWCGRLLYNRSVGLLAAALCCFSKTLAFYSVTVLNTCLGLLMFGIAFALIVSLALEPAGHRALKLVALGVGLGLLVNVRANAVVLAALVPPILFLWRASTPWIELRLALAFVAAFALSATASGSIRGPQFGFNLYIGNNPENPSPYFRPVSFTSSVPGQQSIGFTVEASKRAGHRLTPDQAEGFWVRTVVQHASSHPGMVLKRLGAKAVAIFHRSESDNNHDIRFVGRFLPNLGWAFVPSWLLLALGMAGAVVLRKDRRLLLGGSVFGLYALTLVAVFAGERLRAPLLLVAAPYAAAGLWELLLAPPQLRRTMAILTGLTLVVAAVASRLPVTGANDLSAAYNLHALLLFDEGNLAAAERWYRRSLSLKQQDSPGARIGLGAILAKQGRTDEAVTSFLQVPDSYYDAAAKYEWLGNLALRRDRVADAAQAFGASLALDPSRTNSYKGLYVALRLLGNTALANATDSRLRYIQSFQ